LSAALRWDTHEYQRIASAEYRDGILRVGFEDGSVVAVDPTRLLPPSVNAVEWGTLRHDPYEIVATADGGDVEIPWSTIRLMTDHAYSSHLAELAEEQARRIGLRIKELRTSRGLASKELAARAGITPQSLSRIEHGHHDVVYTTLQRILAAMGYSLRDLAVAPTPRITLAALLKRLAGVGIDRGFVLARLLPDRLKGALLRGADGINEGDTVREIAEVVARVYGWTVPHILGGEPLRLDPSLAAGVRFKAQRRVDELRAPAYTFYAHYIALLTLQSTTGLEVRPMPGDPNAFREAVLAEYGDLGFASILHFVWAHGIPVIPLRDPGAFHGACWRVDGRSIIVLKQITESQARWAHDLLHEVEHVIAHLGDDRPSMVEGEQIAIGPQADTKTQEEREASAFASAVLLTDPEALTARAVTIAGGSIERLKDAVGRVAAEEHVAVDALANYVAGRLSQQKINWWGAATNLQTVQPSPWTLARDQLVAYADLDALAEQDRSMLLRALANPEES